MSDAVVSFRSTPGVTKCLDVSAKSALVLLLAAALAQPEMGNMADKAAGLRAVAYPLMSFTVPVFWVLWWRRNGVPFPWLPDLLITLTCFSDILGNRMDLYDRVVWFDDWMHLMNTGLVSAAVAILTVRRDATMAVVLERCVALGLAAALAWEIAEYFAFVTTSNELPDAYADTLGDLSLGFVGAVLASLAVRGLSRAGRLDSEPPVWPRIPASV